MDEQKIPQLTLTPDLDEPAAPQVKPTDEPTREFHQIKRFEDLQFGRNYHPGETKDKE